MIDRTHVPLAACAVEAFFRGFREWFMAGIKQVLSLWFYVSWFTNCRVTYVLRKRVDRESAHERLNSGRGCWPPLYTWPRGATPRGLGCHLLPLRRGRERCWVSVLLWGVNAFMTLSSFYEQHQTYYVAQY